MNPTETQQWMKELIERIAKDAIELAVVRQQLILEDTGEAPTQEEMADIVADVVPLLTGDDMGCNEPEDADDPEKCALAFLKQHLAAHAPQQWIPVSQSLPEDKQTVLGWHETGMTNPIIVRYIGGRQFHDFFKNWIAITHWQPLPAPPVPETPGEQTEKAERNWQCPRCHQLGCNEECVEPLEAVAEAIRGLVGTPVEYPLAKKMSDVLRDIEALAAPRVPQGEEKRS